jgi:hypothetical protein
MDLCFYLCMEPRWYRTFLIRSNWNSTSGYPIATYVCMYVSIYLCMYLCLCVRTYVCLHARMHVWSEVFRFGCIYIYIYSLWAREKPENVHSRGKNKLPKYVCRYRHVHACFSGKNSCIAQNTCLGPRWNFNVLDVFCKFNPDTNLETTFQQKS